MSNSVESLKIIIQVFSVYSPLAAIALGVIYYKHLTGIFQILFYLLLYGLVNDLATTVWRPGDPWIFNNIYFFFETIAMGFILISIEKRELLKKIMRIL